MQRPSIQMLGSTNLQQQTHHKSPFIPKPSLSETKDHQFFNIFPPSVLATSIGNQIQNPAWSPIEILLAIEANALAYLSLEKKLKYLLIEQDKQHQDPSQRAKLNADVMMLKQILKFMHQTKHDYDWNKYNNQTFRQYAKLQRKFDKQNTFRKYLNDTITTPTTTTGLDPNNNSEPLIYEQDNLDAFLDSASDDDDDNNTEDDPNQQHGSDYNPYALFSLYDPSVGLRYLRAYSNNLALELKDFALTQFIFDENMASTTITATATAGGLSTNVNLQNQQLRDKQRIIDKVKYTQQADLPFACLFPLHLQYTPSYLFDIMYNFVTKNVQVDQLKNNNKNKKDIVDKQQESSKCHEIPEDDDDNNNGDEIQSPQTISEDNNNSQGEEEEEKEENQPTNQNNNNDIENKQNTNTTAISLLTHNIQQYFPHITDNKYISFLYYYSNNYGKKHYVPNPKLQAVAEKIVETIYYRFEQLYPQHDIIIKPSQTTSAAVSNNNNNNNNNQQKPVTTTSPKICQFFPFKNLYYNDLLDTPHNVCQFCQDDTQAHNLRVVGFYNSISPSSPHYNHKAITLEEQATQNINPFCINCPMMYSSLAQANRRADGEANAKHLNVVLEQMVTLLLYINYIYFYMNYNSYITTYLHQPKNSRMRNNTTPSVNTATTMSTNQTENSVSRLPTTITSTTTIQDEISPFFQLDITKPLALLAYPIGTYGQWVFACDFIGFSLFTDNNPSAGLLLSRMLGHYPERLAKALLLDPGFVFNAMWNVLKMLLDQRTSSKVHFIKHSAIAQDYNNIYNDLQPYSTQKRLQIEKKYGNPISAQLDEEEEEEEYCSQNVANDLNNTGNTTNGMNGNNNNNNCNDLNIGFSNDLHQYDIILPLLNSKDNHVTPTPLLVNTLNHNNNNTNNNTNVSDVLNSSAAILGALRTGYAVKTLVNINEYDIDNKLRTSSYPTSNDAPTPCIPAHHKQFKSAYRYNQGLMYYPYTNPIDKSNTSQQQHTTPPPLSQHGPLSSISMEMFIWLAKECMANRNELNINNTMNASRITYLDHYKTLYEYNFEALNNVKTTKYQHNIMYTHAFQQQSIATVYTQIYDDIKKSKFGRQQDLMSSNGTNSSGVDNNHNASNSNNNNNKNIATQHINYKEDDHIIISYINQGEMKHFWVSQMYTYDDVIGLYEPQAQIFQQQQQQNGSDTISQQQQQQTSPSAKRKSILSRRTRPSLSAQQQPVTPADEIKTAYTSFIPTPKDENKIIANTLKQAQTDIKKFHKTHQVIMPNPHENLNLVFAHDARCAPSFIYSGAMVFGL